MHANWKENLPPPHLSLQKYFYCLSTFSFISRLFLLNINVRPCIFIHKVLKLFLAGDLFYENYNNNHTEVINVNQTKYSIKVMLYSRRQC